MKLPNFFDFEPLNVIKTKMGISRETYGDLTVVIDAARLSELELERLSSTDGLDVTYDQITVLPDGTLAYKNSRVLLYIRDIASYGGQEFQPRFHIAECLTLLRMQEKEKLDRYVVSTRLDGRFTINVISSGRKRTGLYDLSVCQHCLDKLQFNGFKRNLDPVDRKNRIKSFRLQDFFEKYPVSLHQKKPRYNEDNAPLNDYTRDFPQISIQFKQGRGWRCDDCSIDLSHENKRRYLHVHHRNAQKWDNRPENLEAICIRCHSAKPDHAHVRNTPDFKQFMKLLEDGKPFRSNASASPI